MQKTTVSQEQIILDLKAKLSTLEARLDARDTVIAKKDSDIKKLTEDIEYLKFQNDQLRRMIFGAKRERFVSSTHPNQLTLDFSPQVEEVESMVKEEREKIKIEYERRRVKKEHPGRMPLPKHLPVKEIILEPEEDTSDMTCIGQEITEELDYTPAKIHINRYIRNKYITKEDEKANQKQVIQELTYKCALAHAGHTQAVKNIARIVLYLNNITINKRCSGLIEKCLEIRNDFLSPDRCMQV